MAATGRRALVYVAAAITAIVALFPFYWLGTSSLRLDHELLQPVPSFIPWPVTLYQFQQLFRGADFLRYLLNSTIVSTGAMIVSVALSTLAAYALCRLRFPGRSLLSRLILISYLFPGVLLLVPLYLLMARLGLLDTLTGLTIVYVTWCAPFSTWILISFFQTVPMELEEAAMVDGTSRLGALWRVVLPVATPGIVSAMIFSFVSSWNEYPLASILLVSDPKKTLPVGLSGWIGLYTVEWGILIAGAVITVLPIIILFAVLGQYFVAGLTEGAVKG